MVRLLIFIVALTFSFSSYASECGIFKVVKGKVEFQKKGKSKYRKARVNKKVCAGDKIKASDAARAKIEMAGGNVINLSPNTELLIETYKHDVAKNEKKVLLNVLYGKIRSNVKQKYGDDEKSHYRVKTKSAVAGVRGTEFLTEFNKSTQQSRVVTFEGEVVVGKFEGGKFVGKVSVKPGQFTSSSPSTDPHPAKEVPPKELAQIDRESNVGGGDSSRGVSNDPAAGGKDDKKKKDPKSKDPKGKDPKNDPKGKSPKGDDPKAGGPKPDGDIAGNGPGPEGDHGPDHGDSQAGSRDPASVGGGDQLPLPDLEDNVDPIACVNCGPTLPPPPPPPPLPPVVTPTNDIIQNQTATVTIIPSLPD